MLIVALSTTPSAGDGTVNLLVASPDLEHVVARLEARRQRDRLGASSRRSLNE